MRKLLVLGVFLFGFIFSYAQETDEEDVKNWKKEGTITFLLNQSAFHNWIAGGQNNISGTLGVNYDFNYLKGDWSWDNKIIASYGVNDSEDLGTRKTDDRFEFNSLLGNKIVNNWSYSFFLNFKTQFTDGYDYDLDLNTDFTISGFINPAYLTFGPGIQWKKNNDLKFNLVPLTSKMTFISDDIFIYDESLSKFIHHSGSDNVNNLDAFGLEPGDTFRYELGFYASGYYRFNLMKNVSVENILNQ